MAAHEPAQSTNLNLQIERLRRLAANGPPALTECVRRLCEGLDAESRQRADAERRLRFTTALLEFFATETSQRDYLESVVEVIRHYSGCRCVGVRVVNDRRELVYDAQTGFGREFLEVESVLRLDRDACACVRVVGERPEPQDLAAMTPGGSFDVNDASAFLESLAENDRRRFRGNCIKFGFRSVAIVPVRYRGEMLGVLHLADERPGMVPRDVVEFIESRAALIGEAIHRFRVEEALRESEDRYRSLVETSPEGIGVFVDGQFAYANPATAELCGVASAPQLLGRSLADLVHVHDRHLVAAMMEQAIREGQSPTGVYRLVRPDGKVVEMEARGIRISFAGRPAVLVLGRDVTERRAAERALYQANELLERMFSSIHVLVAYMDRDFNFIRVNRAYAEADGHKPGYYVGKNHFALFPNAENEALFRRVVETGQPYVAYEKPFVYANAPERGVTYWDWRLEPVRDQQGNVSGLVLSLLNVTDRKRTQQALEVERTRLFSVLNMLPGYVLLHGPDHTVRFANHRFLELFGNPGSRPCYRVMHGRDQPCDACHVSAILSSGKAREWVWTSPEGRDYHVWGYPFADSDGTGVVLELGIDVTERRELEREILEISTDEQRRIGRDLHDVLGQNLTGIAFLSRVLAQRLQAAGAPEHEQAAEISNLANQAVSQARTISRGLCPVELTEEGLTRALEELAERVTRLYGVPCSVECRGPIAVTEVGVATHMYHIAQEAVNNAVKHARPRTIRVQLAATPKGISLTVTDDGIGLPEGSLDGSGMGLRIMNYRADMIGAQLRVRRLPEGGTEVACLVPAHVISERQ